MTDPEFADRTYIEPLSADILHEHNKKGKDQMLFCLLLAAKLP